MVRNQWKNTENISQIVIETMQRNKDFLSNICYPTCQLFLHLKESKPALR